MRRPQGKLALYKKWIRLDVVTNTALTLVL